MAEIGRHPTVRRLNGLTSPGLCFVFLLVIAGRALAGGVTLAWDAVSDPSVVGYMVYSGPADGDYTSSVAVGNTTSYTVSNLVEGATYHFAATAYDAEGTQSGFSNDVGVTIPYSAPVAQFSASTTSGTAPLALNFLNTSTGTISTYAWVFGDGATSSTQNPSHVYSAAGVYTVSLTVTGPGGSNTKTNGNYITVSAPTTTNVSSNLNPSALGVWMTFTATVTGSAPTGGVRFTADGGALNCGAAMLPAGGASSKSATCNTASLTEGTHSIVATYGGDAQNASSSSTPLTQTVTKVTTSTDVVTSLTPSTLGTSVTITAMVSGDAPTGTVNFQDGGTSIGGCSAIALSGSGSIRTAQCATAALAVGAHQLTAAYGGDVSNGGSVSVSLLQVVNKAASRIALASSANPSAAGSSVTFTVSVTGFNPTGSINFTDGGLSITGCGAIALSGSGNTRTAACSTAGLAAATHSIVASYAGDVNNTASASTQAQVVEAGHHGGGSMH